MTAGIIAAAALIGAYLVWLTAGKVRRGSSCCGGHEEPEKRVRVRDRNPKHYPYHYSVQVEGMVCANCVRSVENALSRADGIYAKVDLGRRLAEVSARRPISDKDVINLLSGTSYTVVGFEEQ